jgi:hypothetical protein
MPDYQTPGVYVEEVELGPKPIEGVSTSIAAVVGVTQRGRVQGLPQKVTSYAQFARSYGGFLPEIPGGPTTNDLAYAVQGFFQNGGQQLYIQRVASDNATPSSLTLRDAVTFPPGPGAANYVPTRPANAMPQARDRIDLLSSRGISALTQIVLVEQTDTGERRETATVASLDGDRVRLQAPTAYRFTTAAIVLVPGPAAPQNTLRLEAASPGEWGRNLRVTVSPSSRATARLLDADASTTVAPMDINLNLAADIGAGGTPMNQATLNDAGLLRVNDQLRFEEQGVGDETRPITAINPGNVVDLGGANLPAFTTAAAVTLANPAVGLRVAVADDDVTIQIVQSSSFRSGQRVRIEDPGGGAPLDADVTAAPGPPATSLQLHLTGGNFPVNRTLPPGGTVTLISPGIGNTAKVAGAANLHEGDVVELTPSTGDRVYTTVASVAGDTVTFGDAVPGGARPRDVLRTCEFDVNVQLIETRRGVEEIAAEENFPFLTLVPNSPNNARAQINERSDLLVASGNPSATPAPFNFPVTIDLGQSRSWQSLTGGSDGSPPDADAYMGDPAAAPGQRTGIRALEDIDEISIIAAPGVTDAVVQGALVEQCERLMDRFAVIEGPRGSNMEDIVDYRGNFDTKYAALYYPWLEVYDPLTGRDRIVAPSGHVMGIYARVDNARGVHKAPANEPATLRGISDLEFKLSKADQASLNKPNNINVLRDFRGDRRGFRVWGARVLTSDPEWMYVNVRRLFIYLEESLDEGTQWVVFEGNDEPLWARVRQTVSIFLTRVWRDGALAGASAEEAFFVKCDRSTMTEDDILNGKLIMLIGIAPVRPAEFVIIRIGQKIGGADVSEG